MTEKVFFGGGTYFAIFAPKTNPTTCLASFFGASFLSFAGHWQLSLFSSTP